MKGLIFPFIITLVALHSCEPELVVTKLPVASFSSQKFVTLGNSVTFKDNSSNNPSVWFWDFGDNTFSNLQNPEHTYLNPGVYTVKLTILNNAGIDSIRKSNLIHIGLVDVDSNFYQVVKIGTQYWSAENLKVTRLNNGEPIDYLVDKESWGNHSTSAYCWYNDDPANSNPYGALYNGYAMNTDKLCPDGWIVPDFNNVQTLFDFLGGYGISGGKLKAVSPLWNSSTTTPTNVTGFSAMPSGKRNPSGDGYLEMGGYAYIWMKKIPSNNYNCIQLLYNSNEALYKSFVLTYGFSVRCIKQ
ncbi:MAG TPA: FISUMP domain-containing protein [Bacteroidales bacterium]|nr:FISUMP domain-containing protein [Bacteroidales bacterium]